MGSINTVILCILTLYRPVTIFADLRRILRFRKHCPHQYLCACMYCKLGAKIRTVTIMSHRGLLFIFMFFPFTLYSFLPLSIPPPLSLRKHAKISDSAVIQIRRMVCTPECILKKKITSKAHCKDYFFYY